jgi:hypothetical protein
MDEKGVRASIYMRMNEFVEATAHSLFRLEYECFEKDYTWNGMAFNQLQYGEIIKGLEDGLSRETVSVYANPIIPACVMNYMRSSIVIGDEDYTRDLADILRKQPVVCQAGGKTINLDDMDRVICLCSMAHMGMDLSGFSARRFTADELKAQMRAAVPDANVLDSMLDMKNSELDNVFENTIGNVAGSIIEADDDFEFEDVKII